MADHHHRWMGNLFWRLILVVAVGLAIYVSVSRVVLSTLPDYQETLLKQLNHNVGFALEVGSLSGHLDGFTPVFTLSEVIFNYSPDSEESLYFAKATVALDPWDSLLSMSPRFTELVIDSPEIDINVTNNGQIQSADLTELSDVLRTFHKIVVTNGRLTINSAQGTPLMATVEGDYRRKGRDRFVRARLNIPDVTSISVQAKGIGNPFDINAFVGELHGVVDVTDMRKVGSLMNFSAEGSGKLSFWYGLDQYRPSLAATVSGADLLFSLNTEQSLKLDRFAVDVLLERGEHGWLAQIQNSQFISANKLFELPRIQLQKMAETVEITFSSLDVEPFVTWLNITGLLPEKADSMLTTLQPFGVVDVAELRFDDVTDWMTSWSVRAEVSDIATQPYKGVPGLYGIDAYVEATDGGAQVWIDSDSLVLDLPKLYRVPLVFDRVRGILSAQWQADMLFLEEGLLKVEREAHNAIVQFGMAIPLQPQRKEALTLDLMVATGDADVSVRTDYIPYIVPPKLYDWLDTALPKGHIESVAFIWRGALRDFKSAHQTMQIAAHVRDATVKFQPDWAPFEEAVATVVVDDSRVSAFSQSARLSSAFVEQTSVEVAANAMGGSLLRATARAHDSVPGSLAIVAASPLGSSVQALLLDLSTSGRALVDVDLELNLNRADETRNIDVNINLESASMYSKISNIEITQINGGLDYNSAQGFSDRALTAVFKNQPLDIDIGKEVNALLDAPIFAGRFAAHVSAEDALDWADLGMAIPLTGSAEVVAEIAVSDSTEIQISSTLVGVTVALPEPIGKTAEQNTPVSVAFKVDADAPFDVFWQGRVSARGYRQAGQLVGGTLDLTPRTSAVTILDIENIEGFHLTGYLPLLDVDQWIEKIDIRDFYNEGGNGVSSLTVEALAFDRIHFGGADIGALNLDLTPFDGWDMLGINAHWLDAELTLVRDDGSANLIINTLDLDQMPQLSATDGMPNPPRFSEPLNVIIANLKRGDGSIGAASFSLSSEADQLRVHNIRGQLAAVEILEGTELIWRIGKNEQPETLLTLNSRYDNFGDTLDALAMARTIDTRSGKASANLRWAGNPAALEISKLQGEVVLSMENGSFLPVPAGATGALRILSLLNLADLLGRANITQLFDAGVTFERAKGAFLFDKGQLTIPGFNIDGSGGEFRFVSDIDLIKEQINGDLVVTLPLVNNIPWVAALAGGLPIAAGAFLVSQVFKDQLKTLTSAVYSVRGDLAHPEVKFERVFDAKSAKSRVVDNLLVIPQNESSNLESATESFPSESPQLQIDQVLTEQAPINNVGHDANAPSSVVNTDASDL